MNRFLFFYFLLFTISSYCQVDSDNDGMPDDWELANSLNPSDPTDAFDDPDCDQVINLFEFQLQTDINNATQPKIIEITPLVTQAEFENIVGEGLTQPICVRIQEGQYNLHYRERLGQFF